jgi:glucosamine--fructose-6-phosphate aminotransferase (isomerizing)
MHAEFPILEGNYLRDILNQPQAVADTVAGLRRVEPLLPRATAYTKIVLTGMGSSLHAHHPLLLRLVGAGHTALMVETAELVHAQSALLDEHTLVVAVSQSGRSAETVQLLDLVAARTSRPFVIGITNTADSPLARRADVAVLMQAGPEFSVSCKTYLATLVALEWLGAALCGADLAAFIAEIEAAAGAVQAYLSGWRDHVRQLTDELTGLRHLFLTGRGVSLATVGTGALILKESTHFHVEGMSTPAFRHGPLEMVNPGLLALVFEGEAATAPLNLALVQDIRAAGGRAELVGESAARGAFHIQHVSTRLRPVVEMLPVQMLSLALAARMGREAGRFEHASKVTITP